MSGELFVRLSACFGIPTQWVRVQSLAEASTACRAFIDKNGLGASTWSRGGGEVRAGSQRGPVVASVSYNGRVWPPGAWSPQSVPLWDPYRGAER